MIDEEKIDKQARENQSQMMTGIYQNYDKKGKEKIQLKKRLNQIEQEEKTDEKEEQKREMQKIVYDRKLKQAEKEMRLSNQLIKTQFAQMSKRNRDGTLTVGL